MVAPSLILKRSSNTFFAVVVFESINIQTFDASLISNIIYEALKAWIGRNVVELNVLEVEGPVILLNFIVTDSAAQ
jgi:hypothetical protein